MPKTYVLDTSVLLHNPEALFAFDDNEVVIPFAVIEEIDCQKKRMDEAGRNARLVSQHLDGLRARGRLSDGITLTNGGRLHIELNHQSDLPLPQGMDLTKNDNRILAAAFALSLEGRSAIVVTKDLNLRIKADAVGVSAEDFFNDKVDFGQLYTGVGEITIPEAALNAFYRDGSVGLDEWDGLDRPYANQFFVLRSEANPSQSALARHSGRTFHALVHDRFFNWGVKALNKEQKFALEVLLDDRIQVVTLLGRAGTGKTLLALAAGLEKVLEQDVYARLLITRPVTPMGEDIGFLPGSKEEKLRPWMQPIHDNLELLFSNVQDSNLEDFIERGFLEMDTLTYIRGRSIPNQFIICDEAQNLTPHMIKTLITRVGRGTKIVFTGDPEQIDHPYLDSGSNGLTYLVEKLKGEEIYGHVTLIKGERSKVAELGAQLL